MNRKILGSLILFTVAVIPFQSVRACVNIWLEAEITEATKYVWKDTIVRFDGSCSFDEDGFITQYIWTVSPDSKAYEISGQNTPYFSCKLPIDSTPYTVSLTVYDNQGDPSDPLEPATCTVYVEDPASPTTEVYVKSGGAGAQTGENWGNAFATIQRGINAINAISDIGKVYVWWEDTYEENIDFQGENVLLVSANAADEIVPGAIIQGNGTDPVVRFSGAEDNSCQIIGFTITGGGFAGPESGLQAHWKLDEDSNITAYDETSNDNDGTLAGDPTPTWVVDGGRYGGALQFDGVDDWVDVDFDESLNPVNPVDFTVSLWVKADPPSPTSHRTLIGNCDIDPDVSIGGYWLSIGPGGQKLVFFTGRGGDPYWDILIADNYDVPFYTWTHVAFTFEATSGPDADGRYIGIKKIFANGREVKSDCESEYIPNAASDLRMGNVNWRNDGIHYYMGDMDEVRIYDRVLDADDVQRLYMTYRGGGIHCNHAEPVISHCVITGNAAQYGAGISDCDGIIENCLITNNTVLDGGIGSGIAGCRQAEITNCTIADNDGYGLYDCGPEGFITNCIIWGNTTDSFNDECAHPIFSCIEYYTLEPDRGMVSYWKLDSDTGGTTEDSIGNNEGTIYRSRIDLRSSEQCLNFRRNE